MSEGITYFRQLFAGAGTPGTELAVGALIGALEEEEIRQLAPIFVAEMIDGYKIGVPTR